MLCWTSSSPWSCSASVAQLDTSGWNLAKFLLLRLIKGTCLSPLCLQTKKGIQNLSLVLQQHLSSCRRPSQQTSKTRGKLHIQCCVVSQSTLSIVLPEAAVLNFNILILIRRHFCWSASLLIPKERPCLIFCLLRCAAYSGVCQLCLTKTNDVYSASYTFGYSTRIQTTMLDGLLWEGGGRKVRKEKKKSTNGNDW